MVRAAIILASLLALAGCVVAYPSPGWHRHWDRSYYYYDDGWSYPTYPTYPAYSAYSVYPPY